MKWDCIVIGAGSAGCALTHELINAGKSVLVIEAGGSDRSLSIKVPAGIFRAVERYDWGYQALPDPTRNGTVEHLIRGKVLGGSSSINGMIYAPAPAEDHDHWSAHCGNAGGWSGREITPLIREMEHSDQAGPSRGRSGPLYVKTVKRPHAITRAFMEAAGAAGYPFNEDYNADSQEGVSYVQLTQRHGLRWSAADAFLKPLLGRKNLRLLLNALVERVEVKNGRAVAVDFQHSGTRRRESAHDIILCAGSINSPKLLMLSGIGDSEELRRHNIEIVLDRPGVGRNLKEHPLIRLAYRTKIPTYNPTEGWLQKIGFAAKFLVNGEGPISNLFEGIGFIKSSAAEPRPDVILYLTPVGYLELPGGGLELAPYPSIMVYAAKSYPLSTGNIRLASNRFDDPPVIEYRLLEAQADVDVLVKGIQVIRKIMSMSPIAGLIEEEMSPGGNIQGPAALEKYIRSRTGISLHPIGTCRMGVGEDAVVSPDLLVRGTENLWIADASIFPEHVSANMNAVCIMIGKKLGKQLAVRQ